MKSPLSLAVLIAISATFSTGALAADLIGHTNQGNSSETTAPYSSAYGYNSKAEGQFATSNGSETHAEGNRSTAVGNTIWATSDDSVAIGSYVNSDSNGINGRPNGEASVAVGLRSNSGGTNSVAVGRNTNASAKDGVALGSYSSATRESGNQGYVPEGVTLSDKEKNSATWKATRGEVSVGSDGNTRQITHVAAGSEDTDAVNVAQLKAVNSRIQGDVNSQLQQSEARFTERFNAMSHRLDNRIDNVRDDANAGVAMAIATAGLPQAYLPGKSMFAMAAGTYLGEQGYAIGVSHVMENGHVVLKVTGSGNSQGHFGGSVGAGYQW